MGEGDLGFVGLGVMGQAMAAHLLDAPGDLFVYDVRPEAAAPLVDAGAKACASLAELGAAAPTVFMSLPSPAAVASVATGRGGLVESRGLRVVVDLSTTGSAVAATVATALAEQGVEYLDAPVSGGPQGARSGRLTVMAAGREEVFSALAPLLGKIGSNVLHVGERPGDGQLTKLINNLLSATAMAITGEAVALGVKGGLDPARLLGAINVSSGRNTASEDKYPRCVLTRSFDYGFRTRLMTKDVTLAMAEAERLGTPMLLGSAVREIWALADALADDANDFTTIARLFEEWSGVVIAP